MRGNRTDALDAARRACKRSASITHLQLKRGLNSLASIASTAPLVGLCGAVQGIHDSFGSTGGSKSAMMAYLTEKLSEALAPCAFGIMVALIAMWCYKYLLGRVEAFDSDMEDVSLQLINDLGRLNGTGSTS
jgi:biopolymer transport protein ExbB/TolQ